MEILTSRAAGVYGAFYMELGSSDIITVSLSGILFSTTAVFRDTSSWYHVVLSVSPNSTAILYVNGTQVASGVTGASPSLFSSSGTNTIGRYGDSASFYFDGYITEFYYIDGQKLTPSSFGETDAITGRWKAKAYSGTYGTNGFYLSFKDNTSTTTLGYDDAGSNDWTLNNFSVTAGEGNDSLVDSPTNYGTDTGLGGEVRGNYATLNPLTGNSSVVDGNLRPTGSNGAALSTIGMSSGKWYCEMTIVAKGSAADIGIHTGSGFSTYVGSTSGGWSYTDDGFKRNNNNATSYGATYTTGDLIGCAFDADAGTLVFYKNNVSQGTAFTGLTSGPYFFGIYGRSIATANNVYINFGQRPFFYAAPSGFKALCTQNLPQPTIQKPSTAMDVVTYTGTGASQSISSLGFSPDLVWIKGRSGATDHAIYDTTRGVQQDLGSNLTTDETTQAQGLTAFGTNGFTIGTLAKINTSTATYVGWAWNESALNGLDIVSYTGNGTARTISHNLGVAPKMIIVKARTTAGTDQGWPVYHASNTAAPETDYLLLNSTAATADLDTVWNDTAPTASVFSVGTGALVNTNNDTYIAYLFSEVEGFSKFGSYTGNGSADGPFVWCGFRPRWVMIKRTDAVAGWTILDSGRSVSNVASLRINAESSAAEATLGLFDINSNGFKIRVDGATAPGVNTSGGTWIFAAFAESPFKYARAR
jgi:hypothetical protein